MRNERKILLGAAVLGILSASACDKSKDNKNSEIGECHGVNSCEEKGDCGGVHENGTTYDCSGNNKCKGKGWLKLSKKDCKDRKGDFKPLKI